MSNTDETKMDTAGTTALKTAACTVQKDSRYAITAQAVCCGADVNVTVCGGTRHHIGAVAIAFGRMPDGTAPKYSPAVSSIACLDHKDDRIARRAAVRIAKALGTTVTVTAGIHVDDASPEDLKVLISNAERCVDELIGLLQAPE